MSALRQIPATVRSRGHDARVRRVWPASGRERGRFVLEVQDDSGDIRAGTLAWRGTATAPQVSLLPHGTDRRLPDLAPVAARAGHRIIGHRLGKRAVVAGPDSFVKIVRREATDRVVDAARRSAAFDRIDGVRTPQVLDHAPGVLVLDTLPGRSAHALGAEAALGDWHAAWRTWASGWQRLVDTANSGVVPVDELPTHGPREETMVLAGWVERAVRDGVLAEEMIGGPAARAASALAEGAGRRGGALTLAHRDLHDKQIFFTSSSATPEVGLLDFDTLAQAEPALDLANLSVHADLRERQGLWSPDHAAVVRSTVLTCADALNVPVSRLRAYARSSTVRLACVYAYRPPWQDLAAGMLHDPPALTGWPVQR